MKVVVEYQIGVGGLPNLKASVGKMYLKMKATAIYHMLANRKNYEL